MSRWEFVRELFEETVDLDAVARARVLVERSGGDDGIVRQVERLVRADLHSLDALDGSASGLLHEMGHEARATDLCGQAFDSYRIEEHVSSGGMAHVYRATRTSAGAARRVALKVLRPGLDTAAFLERFQRERELLAALEHEYIVSFLDAGTLPDGRPYLVMEYVEGVALTDWARGVPLRERLELFLRVLATVQYAHQQLVVHRDLKPSNVLVTAQGAPRLLDFGVAAALQAVDEGATDGGPLTPAYASPEQLRGDPVTTASDVFSLGLLLHELATGELPQRGCQGVDTSLGGDLGAVVGKAIRSEPGGRYRSVDGLADDLRSHLDQLPISVRRPTWVYRTSLFARRNRWPVALSGAVVIALIVGWIGSDLERRSASREASAGWVAHGQAKVVAHVLEGWIAAVARADPRLSASAAVHLEAALRDRVADLPEAEAMIRLALAALYLEQADPQRAKVHADRARELARTTRGIGRSERERAAELCERARAAIDLDADTALPPKPSPLDRRP